MSKKWYVVHAYSGFEKSVQRTLTERIKRSELSDQFGVCIRAPNPRNRTEGRFSDIPRDGNPARTGMIKHRGEFRRGVPNEFDDGPCLSHRASR